MTAPELELPEDPTPIDRWGKDHWSTFAYAHTRAVDHDGALDHRHMRGHREGDADRYPTRLKDGEIPGHSDLDCLLDAAAHGLLEIIRDSDRDRTFVCFHRVTFTAKGNVLAGKLAAHKADGGRWADFEPGAALGLHVAGRE